jgi:hypothetical protein
MKIRTIAFTLEKTTPLEPLTRNDADRYANVKPAAHVEIEIDEDDGDAAIAQAWELARNTCFNELVAFHNMLVESIRG